MNKEEKTIIGVAVEDEEVLMASYSVTISDGGRKYVVSAPDSNKTYSYKRKSADPTSPYWCVQHDGTVDDLTSQIVKFSGRVGMPDMIGISAFGMADFDMGMLTQMPFNDLTLNKLQFKPTLCKLLGRDDIVVTVENDATCAMWGEYVRGAGGPVRSAEHASYNMAYLWAGYGINVGVIHNGEVVKGKCHPELAHLPVRRIESDKHMGSCKIHHDCIHGMASLRSIKERGVFLDDSGPFVSEYIAQLCAALEYSFSPEKIILGGTLFHQSLILNLEGEVLKKFKECINGYPPVNRDNIFVRAKLGNRAALIGIVDLTIRNFTRLLKEQKAGVYAIKS